MRIALRCVRLRLFWNCSTTTGHWMTSNNPTMMKTQSIRELRALQAKALEAYHAEHRRLEAEIQAIRTVRGTKLKEKVFESYHEPGRSRERFPGGQSY